MVLSFRAAAVLSASPAASGATLVLVLRFIKVVSVSVFAAGLFGAFVARDIGDRRRFAYAMAGPGFGASWIAGFLLAWATSVSFLSTWILGGLASSFVALQVVLFSVGREGRRTLPVFAFAAACLLATLAFMVFRPDFGGD